MTVIEWTRPAKCKDCKFLKAYSTGKLKRHSCTNPASERFETQQTLNNPVCLKWEL